MANKDYPQRIKNFRNVEAKSISRKGIAECQNPRRFRRVKTRMNDQSLSERTNEPCPGLAPKKYEGKRIRDKMGTGCT
jgi:hypothetical protein